MLVLSYHFCLFTRCGSGLSGDYLTEEGHHWVGVDISPAMLGRWYYPILLQFGLVLSIAQGSLFVTPHFISVFQSLAQSTEMTVRRSDFDDT